MEIGAQFYTLRDKAQDLNGLSECLKRVRDIGYTCVQLSGVCSYEADWIKEQLKANDLKCVLTHYNGEEIKNNTEKAVEWHKSFGCNYIGLGIIPTAKNFKENGITKEDVEEFIKQYKAPAQKMKELGSKLFIHNHHWEMGRIDGELILDIITKEFDVSELSITLDTYWVQYGGMDPAELIKRLKGRVECVHAKDFVIVGNEQRMAAVGQGNLNFERIVNSCYDAGTEYLLVEQDNCYGDCPFECLKKSYEYLKRIVK
jgi:sugar phosphate isomerase/epimerase